MIIDWHTHACPPLFPLKQRGLAIIDELGLEQGDKEKVLAGNAKRLLKLD